MKNQTKYFGRTQDFTPVILLGVNELDIGKIIYAKMERYNRNSLFGLKKTKMKKEVAA